MLISIIPAMDEALPAALLKYSASFTPPSHSLFLNAQILNPSFLMVWDKTLFFLNMNI